MILFMNKTTTLPDLATLSPMALRQYEDRIYVMGDTAEIDRVKAENERRYNAAKAASDRNLRRRGQR